MVMFKKGIFAFLSLILLVSSFGNAVLASNSTGINSEKEKFDISGEEIDWDQVEWYETPIENERKDFNDSEELNLDKFEFISIEEAEAIQKEYGIEVINEDQLSDFQPLWWHIIGRVVWVGGSYVVKVGTRIFTKQAPEKATAALRSFTPTNISIGSGRTVALQNSSMNHVLTNHHPLYWTGATGKTTFHYNLAINDVRARIISIVNANRSTIISGNGYATINVSIDGQMYRLVVSNYRINTFYPY
ncbi:hypothetical protein AK95_00655 [Paenibacillus sp. LC231]|nr:hypothetical protein AK95_00655 [Paenibacillus sp. LC231]